jgi:hypothetical protein
MKARFVIPGFFVFVFLCGFAGLLLMQYIVQRPPDISSVVVDTESEWGKYFLATTGFPMVEIVVLDLAKGTCTDHVSFVGKGRTEEWFTGKGFEDVFEASESRYLSYAGIVPKDRVFQHILCMNHPKWNGPMFIYVPELGLLISNESR